MGDSSGGDQGGSNVNNLKDLIQIERDKFKLLNINDKRWPCPFCITVSKTKIQCRIHIQNDHPNIYKKNEQEFSQFMMSQSISSSRTLNVLDNNFSQSNVEKENKSQNSTSHDLLECLDLINDEIDRNSQFDNEGSRSSTCITCSHCGFNAKNNRGLNIHLHTCRKKKVLSNNVQDINLTENQSESSVENLIKKLISLRSQKRIIKRIPKGARKIVCEELTKTIIECTTSKNSESSWEKLLTFAYNVLYLPSIKEKRNCSLATIIRRNIMNRGNPENTIQSNFRIANTPSKNQLIKSATDKLSDGDIKGCVRILSSDEVIAPHNLATLQSLIDKHPKRTAEIINDDDQFENYQHVQVSRPEIIEAIRTFDNGSAGGIDGLRPQHLKDLIAPMNGDLANKLIDALGFLNDKMLSGKVPDSICSILYGATLTALMKKSGGIRPIAVGNTLRRLAAKISCNRVRDDMSNYLRPHQTGFGVPNGAEAVVHSIRNFILSENQDSILVKLDYSNAFNSKFRAKMLQIVKEKCPNLFPFVSQCYVTKSFLCYGQDIIMSEEGVQQGDPLGPLLFCLVIQPIIDSITSPVNEWYLDDGSVGGAFDSVIKDLIKIIKLSEEVGLNLNPSKCEVLRIKPLSSLEIEELNKIIPGILVPPPIEYCLLGASLTLIGIPEAISQKLRSIEILISRLSSLNAHQALFILRNCLCIPKMMYLLRTTPCWLFKENLKEFDLMIKRSTSKITNVNLDGIAWTQCSLPIRKGGLGLTLPSDIASSAFISSMLTTENLKSQITEFTDDELFSNAINEWKLESSSEMPIDKLQKSWTQPIMDRKFEILFVSLENDACQKARLLASSQEESGLWLQALPSTSLGLCLDNDTLRIAVALRLGAEICHPHTCVCGKEVDSFGHHGLCCGKCAGRHPRHHSLNETYRKAMVSAGIPAILEPPGTVREDGKRPDGLTLIPWSHGKSLLWDVTCVDTLAKSYISRTSKNAGSAAKLAEENKVTLYHSVLDRYIFAPLVFETLGPWGPSTKYFVSEVGKRITELTKEKRSTSYLKQRLSIDIQRGNAASILGTVPSSCPLDEVYYLISTGN